MLGTLPAAVASLAKQSPQSEIVVFIPKYSVVNEAQYPLKLHPGKLRIPMGSSVEEGFIWSLDRPAGARRGKKVNPSDLPAYPKNLSIYFIESKKYFSRDSLYRAKDGKDYADNDSRFIFFARAALEFCKFVDFKPDVVHAHDWQAGLIPGYLATLYQNDSFFQKTVSVFTIHNIAYQGFFPKKTYELAGFDPKDFVPEKFEYFGHFSFLKTGLVFAHKISTVSPTYAREVQGSAEFGRGMEGVLRVRAKDFTGILNGLSYAEWDPAKDRHLTANFSAKSKDWADKKRICKKDLQRMMELPLDENVPIFGIVSRLDPQKGFHLLGEMLPRAVEKGLKFQLAVLGTGDPDIEAALKEFSERWPDSVAVHFTFNEPLAHKIYAGSDFFLMPSMFEPCGLSQMIAMAYGTIPVVTPTGGLVDTIQPWDPDRKTGNGFMCDDVSSAALLATFETAVQFYPQLSDRTKLIQNALATRFTWENSAAQYMDLYSSAILSHLANVRVH